MSVKSDTLYANVRRYELYDRPGPMHPLPLVISRLQPLVVGEGANPLNRPRLREALALPVNELSVILRDAEQYRLLLPCVPEQSWMPSQKAMAIATGIPGEVTRLDAIFQTAREPRLFHELMDEAFPLGSPLIRTYLRDHRMGLPASAWPRVARAYGKTMAFLLEEEALLGELMPRDQAVEAFEKALPIWRDVTFPHSVEGLADLLGLDTEDDEGDLMVAYHFQLAWEQLGLLQKGPWPMFVPTPRALQELRVPPAGEQEQKFAES